MQVCDHTTLMPKAIQFFCVFPLEFNKLKSECLGHLGHILPIFGQIGIFHKAKLKKLSMFSVKYIEKMRSQTWKEGWASVKIKVPKTFEIYSTKPEFSSVYQT